MAKQSKTSWESSSKWYDQIVGEKGHYYHEHVIFPSLLPLLALKANDHLLDLACGQGVLSRTLPKGVSYTGVEISSSLIASAKKRSSSPKISFLASDVTRPIALPKEKFSHATILLALQNIADPTAVFKNAHHHLKKGGEFFLVLNHPCFRIPRQSHWEIDEGKKLQYRRIDSYMSPQKIPIQTHPGKKKGETLSFHHSLSDLSKMLKNAGFVITFLDEWVSDKKSTGGRARMENRARKEFPLFLLIACEKI